MFDAYVYLHPPEDCRIRRVHLAHYDPLTDGPTLRALCGLISETMVTGEHTRTGVHASCRSCRQQLPATVAYETG